MENEQAVENQEPEIKVSDWVNKFKQSERLMKSEFKWKYQIAKNRLRAESEIKNKDTRKMSHEQVNVVYSIGQSYVNSVYFKSPNCNLTAREEVEHEKVENTEIKVNDWLKDKKVKKAIRRNIWDSYLGGFGARFIDHEYDHLEDPNNVIKPGKEAQIDPITGQETSPAIPPVLGRIVLKNDIVFHRIRPDLVRFPKGFDFDNYQESPWIGFDIIHPIEYVKDNAAWDKNGREAIQGEKYSKLSDSDSQNATEDEEATDLWAKISYVFQKQDNAPFKLLVFCHKYNEAPLQYVDYDKGHIGYPIKFLYSNPLDDDKSYPNGDCWNMESQFQAFDIWWQKMVQHVKRSSPKRLYDSGSITPQEIQKMKGNSDLEWVGVANQRKADLRSLVMELQAPQVHPDTSRLYEVARQLVSEIGPKCGLSRGAEDAKTETATEAKIVNTGDVIDIEARIDDVRDYIIDIVLDVAGILEKSFNAPTTIQKPVLDEMGNQVLLPNGRPASQTLEVDKSGFTSKITADADVESMQAQNKDVFRRQLLDFLNFLVKFEPVMNKSGKTIDPLFWLERIMETMNIRNIEKGIVDMPIPALTPITPGASEPGPLPSEATGAMPPEAIEAGMAQRV